MSSNAVVYLAFEFLRFSFSMVFTVYRRSRLLLFSLISRTFEYSSIFGRWEVA